MFRESDYSLSNVLRYNLNNVVNQRKTHIIRLKILLFSWLIGKNAVILCTIFSIILYEKPVYFTVSTIRAGFR